MNQQKKGYHLIWVPRDPQKTKRVFITSNQIKIFSLVGGFALLFLLLMTGTGFYFQKKSAALSQDLAFIEKLSYGERGLSGKLGDYEEKISKLETEINQLETIVAKNSVDSFKAMGPIDEPWQSQVKATKKLKAALVKKESAAKASLKVPAKSNQTAQLRWNSLGIKISELRKKTQQIKTWQAPKIRFFNLVPSELPVKQGWLTSGYGMRRSPHSGRSKMHYGIDIAATTGTPIYAPTAGVVLIAEQTRDGYGKKIVLDHGFGISTTYAHASKLHVEVGQQVKKGQKIGLVGSTGASTGPHLHYELHFDGVPIDPMRFMKDIL